MRLQAIAGTSTAGIPTATDSAPVSPPPSVPAHAAPAGAREPVQGSGGVLARRSSSSRWSTPKPMEVEVPGAGASAAPHPQDTASPSPPPRFPRLSSLGRCSHHHHQQPQQQQQRHPSRLRALLSIPDAPRALAVPQGHHQLGPQALAPRPSKHTNSRSRRRWSSAKSWSASDPPSWRARSTLGSATPILVSCHSSVNRPGVHCVRGHRGTVSDRGCRLAHPRWGNAQCTLRELTPPERKLFRT